MKTKGSAINAQTIEILDKIVANVKARKLPSDGLLLGGSPVTHKTLEDVHWGALDSYTLITRKKTVGQVVNTRYSGRAA